MIRLCVFGSRRLRRMQTVFAAIDAGISDLKLTLAPIDCLVHGGARGVDRIAARWAYERGIEVMEFPALWDDLDTEGAVIKDGPFGPYNARAGHDRNARMVDYATHFVGVRMADGLSPGTDDMRRQVIAAGKPLAVVLHL